MSEHDSEHSSGHIPGHIPGQQMPATGDAQGDSIDDLPVPNVKQRSGPSFVWLIPLVTLIAGLWLVFTTVAERGPLITIRFASAEGIQAGKTPVRYKNVDIGVVEEVRFSGDYKQVIVSARIERDATHFLKRSTKFWVVKPRLGVRGVSGIGTILSGGYIELDPGEGSEAREFLGLEVPPLVSSTEAGKRISLVANRLGSVDIGSPIFYQGIEAGEVLGYALGDDQQSVFIHAFVKSPFDSLVQGNTRFWNVSGVDMKLDANGVQVSTESMQSVLFGGIAFKTPKTLERIHTDKEALIFKLYDSEEAVTEQRFERKVHFVMFFDGSVRGLTIGAPVEFKGIKIGSVLDVRLEFDARDTSFRIPVLVEIEPERIIARDPARANTEAEVLQTLVDRGLRARLSTGSLLTGSRFVELDMHPETQIVLRGDTGPYPELPTIPAQFDEFTDAIKGFLAKLDEFDVKTLSDSLVGTVQGAERLMNSSDLKQTLEGVNRLVNNDDLHASMTELKTALARISELAETADGEIKPVSRDLKDALKAAKQALDRSQQTLAGIDRLVRPNSPLQSGVLGVTDEFIETLRAIRTMVETLERNPESLLYGKQAGG